MKETENRKNEDSNSEIDGGESNLPGSDKGNDAWWDDLVAAPRAEELTKRSGLPFALKRRGNVKRATPDTGDEAGAEGLPQLKKRNPVASPETEETGEKEDSPISDSPAKVDESVVETTDTKDPEPVRIEPQTLAPNLVAPSPEEESEDEKPASDPKSEKEVPKETKSKKVEESEPASLKPPEELKASEEKDDDGSDISIELFLNKEPELEESKPEEETREPIAEKLPAKNESEEKVEADGEKISSTSIEETTDVGNETVEDEVGNDRLPEDLSKPLVSSVLSARLQPSGSSADKDSLGTLSASEDDDGEDDFFTRIEKNRNAGNVRKSSTPPVSEPDKDEEKELPDGTDSEGEAEIEEDFVSIGAEEDPWFADDKEAVAAAGNKPRHPQTVKQKKGCWTIFATLFFFGTLFLVLAVAGAGAYAWSKKDSFVEDAQKDLMTGLEERGIFLTYGDWSYQFPRGLVFSEMTFFQTKAKEKPALKISNVGLSTDVVSLAKSRGKEAFGTHLDLADSTASIYGEDGTATELKNLVGKIIVEETQITLSPLSTMVGGLEVVLNGAVQLPSDQETAPAADGTPEPEAKSKSAGIGFDPVILETLQEWFALSATGKAPVLRADLDLDLNAPDQLALSGTLAGGDFLWKGMEFDSVSIPFGFQMDSEVLSLQGFFAAVGGGVLGGEVVIDGKSEQIQIAKLDSTADLHGILSQSDPELAAKLGTLAFLDNPRVILKGTIPLASPKDSSLEIDYSQWKGFEILIDEKKIPVSKISGVLTLEGRKLSTTDMLVSVFGGDCVIPGGFVSFEEEGFLLDGRFEVDRMPLAEVAKFYGIDDRLMRGDLTMNFRGSRGKDIASMKGNGKIQIENARLNGFPVVGPVQMFTGTIIPAFSRQSSSLLLSSFIIEAGVLITSDISVSSPETLIVAGAQVDLADGSNGIQAKAYVDGELAERSGFVDKAITMRGVGSLASPEMELKELPLELADETVQTSLGMTPASIEVVSKFFLAAETSEAPAEEGSEGSDEDAAPEDSPEEASADSPAPAAVQSKLGAPVFSD